MPIYEYKCSDCGHVFEKLQPSSESLPGNCPECGLESLKKKFSVFSAGAASSGADCRDACPAAAGCAAGGRSPCAGGACPMSGL